MHPLRRQGALEGLLFSGARKGMNVPIMREVDVAERAYEYDTMPSYVRF